MTDHKHLWDAAGICRECGLDANKLAARLSPGEVLGGLLLGAFLGCSVVAIADAAWSLR